MAEMRINALSHAKTFNIENILPKYEAFYQKVIDQVLAVEA